jgi:hypothetical protein
VTHALDGARFDGPRRLCDEGWALPVA